MRLHRILSLVFVSIFILSACSHAPVPVEEKVQNAPEGVTGVVLDLQSLSQGGNMGLIPFKAGAKAEANDELDHLSMLIVKGIKDVIDEKKTNLHVVDSTEVQPKLALAGFVKEYSQTGRMSRMMLHPNEDMLSLEGEIWLVSNGQRVLSFAVSKNFLPKKERPIDVAYALGRDIGDYIIKQAKNCSTDNCE